MDEVDQAFITLKDIEINPRTNAKIELLKSQQNNLVLQRILYFALNPYIRTGIGKVKLAKSQPEEINVFNNIEDVFDYLLENNTGRDEDVLKVKSFILSLKSEFQKMASMIFTKTLNIGISEKTVNKVYPNLIPTFAVQLAHRYDDYIDKLQGKEICITEKLDGNRCFAQVNKNQATLYTRSGRIMEGMDEIENELSQLVDGWYDGELIAKDFNATQSQTLKKGKKKDLIFNIFDYLTLDEVVSQQCRHIYIDRRERLNQIFYHEEEFNFIKTVPIISKIFFDENYIGRVLNEWTSKGSEGIMLNITDGLYEFKRTENLIKVKKMYTLDLRVLRMEEGSGQNENTLGNIIVNYEGYEVGVGSGFSKDQRNYFWKHPESIIGKIVEIQCFEETTNKNGTKSLRFPVFLQIRNDKEEESYD